MDTETYVQSLLVWYDCYKREMPWRQDPANPYHTLISEVMLQQTTVATVRAYFLDFIERWPTLEAFAQAELQEVLHAWQGLGYYSRARHLLACAKAIVQRGEFPKTADALQRLPGLGPYAAAAIASIAFNEPVAVVDGNVIRVITRLLGLSQPMPQVRKEVQRIVQNLTPTDRPGDFAQAMMDLGATVCRPKTPSCLICPWRQNCIAHQQGNPETFPVKPPKADRPIKTAVVYWIETQDQKVWIRQRPPHGLLANLWEFPTTSWSSGPANVTAAQDALSGVDSWFLVPKKVVHIFTHLRLELTVIQGVAQAFEPDQGHFHPIAQLSELPFPTLMQKVIRILQRPSALL